VIATYDLPGEFPEEVNAEARRLTTEFESLMDEHESGGIPFRREERWDLRDALITTIDPPDAKDYDDAISIERLDEVPGGGPGWRLGVHIADVANFIAPGGAIDREAVDRANSCYLPRLVIPMLPEILSNGICSLQEGVPRFAKSVFLEYNRDGKVVGRGFAATVIKSRKRMTYLEAQHLIDGKPEEAAKHAKTTTEPDGEVVSALKEMDRLARVIRDRRKRSGMIHLDLPEVELVFDEDGNVTDAVPEDDAFTHTIIEMFMVEANEAIATVFEEMDVPLIRRTHPEPVPGDTEGLRDFVRVAGYKIPKSPTREDLQGLLDATAGTPAAHAVHMAVLQTLTKAEYSPALVGHFALASEAYAHFTSPIRRYPDLTVHRSLTKYLELTKNGTDVPKGEEAKAKLGKRLRDTDACPDEQKLAEISGQCNRREQNATAAERELRSVLVMQYLEREHMGEELPGVVTGVMPNGVFVQLEKYLAEGMCKVEDLPVPEASKQQGGFKKAVWQVDKRTGALVERNSGRSYNIGDRVTIVISQIDLPRRQMDLVIADAGSRERGKAKRVDGSRDRAGLHGLNIGEVEEWKPKKTGAEKRAQRSRGRDKRKKEYRQEKKDKGKRM
jgi:ribonuclease R